MSIKVRRHDFSTLTRSRTLAGATDRAGTIAEVASSLLAAVDVTEGVRLLGVGVAGLTDLLQEDLFAADLAFLQDLYRRVNTEGHTRAAITCPACSHRFAVDVSGGRLGE